MSEVSIRITTKNLLEILTQNPEAELAIEGMAAEKVAQQLVDKFIKKRELEVMDQVKKLLDKKLLKSPKYSYSPSELSAMSTRLISEYVEIALEKTISKKATTIEEAIKERVVARLNQLGDKIMNGFLEECEESFKRLERRLREFAEQHGADIKVQARAEFLSVLAEVKGAVS